LPDQRPPLRLSFEPDNYLCTWSIPDGKGGSVKLPGNLEVLPERPPRGSVYGPLPIKQDTPQTGITSTSFPQIVEAPVLEGTMANGGSIMLIDARISYWTTDQGFISAAAALLSQGQGFLGVPLRSASQPVAGVPLFSTIEFQTTGLDSIFGFAPIKSVQTPGMGPNNPRDLWSANLNLDASSAWETEEASLHVGYNGRMRTMDAYEFILAFSPVAAFGMPEPVSLRFAIDEFVESFRRIISIATGQAQDLTYVSVEAGNPAVTYQVFGAGITQAPFASSTDSIRSNASAIRARSDNLSLLDLVLKWRRYAAEHHPLVETYGSMLHARDQHPRSRFLLLIQALEGMHGHVTKNDFNRRKTDLLSKREAVINSLEGHLDRDAKKFLKRYLLKSPPTSLETALNSMVRDLPVDVMDRLADTSLVAEATSEPPHPTTTAGALRVVRNNLAHGNRGYDARALNDAVRILELIVRGHSLRILGCPDDVVKRIFDEP
jgi:hypothetical protein